jgi:hypothetical protein
MPDVIVHYDNPRHFRPPHLWIWYAGPAVAEDLAQTGVDDFGPVLARCTSFRRAGSRLVGLAADGGAQGERGHRLRRGRVVEDVDRGDGEAGAGDKLQDGPG